MECLEHRRTGFPDSPSKSIPITLIPRRETPREEIVCSSLPEELPYLLSRFMLPTCERQYEEEIDGYVRFKSQLPFSQERGM